MNIYFHRTNMSITSEYDPATVVKVDLNLEEYFGNFQYWKDGSKRNYSSQIEKVIVGDIVILECRNHLDGNYNGIWGVTKVEKVIDTNTLNGKRIIFSKSENLYLIYPAIPNNITNDQQLSMKILKKETLDKIEIGVLRDKIEKLGYKF